MEHGGDSLLSHPNSCPTDGVHLKAFAALARIWGWPHREITVSLTADTDEAKTALLEELCWHRLLDMLGAFMTVSPQGGRIAGSIATRRVGHAADIELIATNQKDRVG